MSVLLEMSMFPIDQGESKSEYVAKIVALIRESGYTYQLTAMATIIETNKMSEALDLASKCYDILEDLGCNRVFATLKFDIRKNHNKRMQTKVASIEKCIGSVSK